MAMKLVPGERVACEAKVTHYRQKVAVRGRLRVTNRRVVFEPDALNVKREGIELPLTDIKTVRRRKTLWFLPTRLAITLSSGETLAFGTRQRDHLAGVLKGLLRQEPSA